MDQIDNKSEYNKKSLHSTTTKLSRDTFVEGISVKQRACLEILGSEKENRIVELEEKDLIIGRIPECGISISVENVSREHARVIFRNEEYFVEDLGSTNGTYVNGIKIVKCVLRNSDQINIGGVKILFTEDKTLQKT
jgi:adenylate cyclase